MTPTHDELVRFAAAKLGKEVVKVGEYWEEQINERWQRIFDITSWDLMGKGMEVCPYEIDFEFDPNNPGSEREGYSPRGIIILENSSWKKSKQERFNTIPDLPLAFWTAWYRLEHEQ